MNPMDNKMKMARPNCTLYVGGLIAGDRNTVRKAFESYGSIERVDYLEAKACAFVKFEDAGDARTAMEEMHGARVAGQNVRCRWAKERSVSLEESDNVVEQRKNRSRTPASPPLKIQRMNTPDEKKSSCDQGKNTPDRRNAPHLRKNTQDTFNQWKNTPDRWSRTPEHGRLYPTEQLRDMSNRKLCIADTNMSTPNCKKGMNVTDQRMNTPDGKKIFSDKRRHTKDENMTPLVQRLNTPDNKKSPLLDKMTRPIPVEKAEFLVQKTNTPVQKICTSNEKDDLRVQGIKTPVSNIKFSTPIRKTSTPLQENRQQGYQTPNQNSPRNQYRQSPNFSARKIKTNKENFANGTWLQVPDCKSLPPPPSRWLKLSPEISNSAIAVSTPTCPIPSSLTINSSSSTNQISSTV